MKLFQRNGKYKFATYRTRCLGGRNRSRNVVNPVNFFVHHSVQTILILSVLADCLSAVQNFPGVRTERLCQIGEVSRRLPTNATPSNLEKGVCSLVCEKLMALSNTTTHWSIPPGSQALNPYLDRLSLDNVTSQARCTVNCLMCILAKCCCRQELRRKTLRASPRELLHCCGATMRRDEMSGKIQRHNSQ